jgi:DNA-binding PadR family transcriptional regulator
MPTAMGQDREQSRAKSYAITRAGAKAFREETAKWRQLSGLVDKLLAEEA